jgi:hypothetical protein
MFLLFKLCISNISFDCEQEFFKLTVAAFENLSHVSGRRYDKALAILENLSKIKIFLIMLDLECDDLVIQMFNLFLRIIRLVPSQHIFFYVTSGFISTYAVLCCKYLNVS